ncbi:hypothetical protein TNCV_2912881 [Trichonephila clavipes]|nr:hypothetical protein TNCV_2912881 [Trichonephila clavipes]
MLFTTDIQMMFRQILIDPAQRDFLRIMWKTGAYVEPVIYRLKTVTPRGTQNRSIHSYIFYVKLMVLGYADASESFYRAVVYMHSLKEDGTTTTKLIGSKSCVALNQGHLHSSP